MTVSAERPRSEAFLDMVARVGAMVYTMEVQRGSPMKHQQRIPRRQVLHLQSLYAAYFADSLEYCEEHLDFLRDRRRAVLAHIKN